MTDADTTNLLNSLQGMDAATRNELYRRIYDALAVKARAIARAAKMPMVETGVLIHELFLKLDQRTGKPWTSRAHFLNAASKAMRNICKDIARSEIARLRRENATAKPEASLDPASAERMLAIDALLNQLGTTNTRHARILEMMFFAEMSHDEIAEVLGEKPETIRRDWDMLRAVVARELNGRGFAQ